jgi:hypothetical protein
VCVRAPVGSNQKTVKMLFVGSPLNTQLSGKRAKTGWLDIRIMCPSGATCLCADCCFSELALYKKKNPTKRVGLVQNGELHHLIEN